MTTNQRVRIVRLIVNIDAVVDDGENLTPVTVQPVTLTAAEAGRFDVAAIAAQLQAQVDQQSADAEPPPGPGEGQENGQQAPHDEHDGDDLPTAHVS